MKLSPAQYRALHKAFTAAPRSISTDAAGRRTMYLLAERGLLVSTHGVMDRPTFRISDRGSEVIAEIRAAEADKSDAPTAPTHNCHGCYVCER
jgi:hypothetical protein